MNPGEKVCQNCKNQFIIEPEDFQFYEKIKVPPPTWCPRCRLQRRLAWFNLFNLYKRPCDLCKQDVISMYSPEAPYKVYCEHCWWSDGWDPFQYGRDYDFSKPFFQQFNELLHEVPLLGLSVDLNSALISKYNNHVGHLKNGYLIFWGNFNEDVSYAFFIFRSKTVLNSSVLILCEACYDLMHAYKDNRCIASKDLNESVDCAFMRDSANCQNCFGSANLRNKKYYIFNKPYTREEYFEEMKKWDLGSYAIYQKAKKTAHDNWKEFPPMPTFEDFAINCSGNRVYNSKNCKQCFEVNATENSKYLLMMADPTTKDCYDISGWGENLSLSYDSGVVGENSSEIKFCHDAGINLYHAEYCKMISGGSYQFGCVSAKKGKYCILNKRYTEDEFQKLREKIVKHMDEIPYVDKKGRVYRYGEFFPIELSPHTYNETIASNFFPLSKDEIASQGYRFRETDVREYIITKKADELPDHIKDVGDELLNEVIGCIRCPRGFKVSMFELDFLRKMKLPLPRECPFCRIGEKFSQWIKEFDLVRRSCSKCGGEFETQYKKEEFEYILCKKCYLQEVT